MISRRVLLSILCLLAGIVGAVEPSWDDYSSDDPFAPERTGKEIEFYELKGPQAGASSYANLVGRYPLLKWVNVEIAQRRLQTRMTGSYPLLEEADFSNSKGKVKAVLTGDFPLLRELSVSTIEGEIEVDLRGKWESDCEIEIRSSSGDIELRLPRKKGLGLVVTTITSEGRVTASGLRHASGWRRERRYLNGEQETAPVVLTVKVRTEGNIKLSY